MGNCFADDEPCTPKKDIKKPKRTIIIGLNSETFDQWMRVVSIDKNYTFKLADPKGVNNMFIEPGPDEVEKFIRKLKRNPLDININSYLSKNCILINMTVFNKNGIITQEQSK